MTTDAMTFMVPAERDVVFNVVWIKGTFDHLCYFVSSQMAWSAARFRFLANGCPPEEVAALERFAAAHPDRVVEVSVLSPDKMLRHGDVLDPVLRRPVTDEVFALIDADIVARGPFLGDFCELLADHAAVSSGKGVWIDDPVIPEGHPGVNGEYFYTQDGFTFGGPHLALYHREPLLETCERWGIGFGSAGPDLSEQAKAALTAAGHRYWAYDTGKLVNAFLQIDGHAFLHREHANILHVGGVSHYFSPRKFVERESGPEPDWATWKGVEERYRTAHFTGAILAALIAGRPAPPVPDDVGADIGRRLSDVRDAMMEMMEVVGP